MSNNTFTNSSDTITFTLLQEYLNDPMVVFLVIITWSFMVTNHKYRQTLDILATFKKQSADEIFSLQQSISQYMYDASLQGKAKGKAKAKGTSAWPGAPDSWFPEDEVLDYCPSDGERHHIDSQMRFTIILKAVKNYCAFRQIPMSNVSLDDVSRSSAGISGWSNMKIPFKKPCRTVNYTS